MAPARVVYSRAPPENPRGARLAAAPRPHRVRRRLARRAMMAASLQRVTGWCAPSGAERCAVSLNGVAEALRPFLSVDKPAFRELSRKVKVLGQQGGEKLGSLGWGPPQQSAVPLRRRVKLNIVSPLTCEQRWGCRRSRSMMREGSKGESKQCQDKRHWIAIPWRWL